jgi:hypothetical protein
MRNLGAHVPRQLNDLLNMLSYCRPAGSRSERKFRNRYLRPLNVETDSARNLHLVIDHEDGTPSSVLWSAHTDTVHRQSGRQRLKWDGFTVRLAHGSQSSCLGADDTVGVWLLREMALARVPGHYVWHYGEEIGGVGSSAIVWDEPERFAGLTYAIAFDRAGTSDVITHQIGGRTCSDVCARSIASELARAGLPGYTPARGIFTDTANYSDTIAECTNLSIGYSGAHSPQEATDLRHAAYLLTAMLKFDERNLTASRHAGEDDPIDLRPFWNTGKPYADPAAPSWYRSDYGHFDRQDWRRDYTWEDERRPVSQDAGTDDPNDAGWDYSRYEDADVELSAFDRSELRRLGMVYQYRRH